MTDYENQIYTDTSVKKILISTFLILGVAFISFYPSFKSREVLHERIEKWEKGKLILVMKLWNTQ